MDQRFGRLLDTQCARPVAICDDCQGEIYRRDTAYYIDGALVCECCVFDRLYSQVAGLAVTGEELEKYGR